MKIGDSGKLLYVLVRNAARSKGEETGQWFDQVQWRQSWQGSHVFGPVAVACTGLSCGAEGVEVLEEELFLLRL